MPICVKVRKEIAETTRKELQKKGLLDYSYSPKVFKDFVFFPVKEAAEGLEIVKLRLKRVKAAPRSLAEALEKMGIAPYGITKSFDIVGDIAILDIPENFSKYESKIADAVMIVHKNVRTVMKKVGPIYGKYRLRKFKILKGQKRTETTHRESGCSFKLDVTKVYFSPRLVFERERIAHTVRANEMIFVPFAGVGPFPIIIAKKRPDTIIYANELNPLAWRYLKENIRLNGTSNVIPFFGDVRKVSERFVKEGKKFDRIVMPLPMGAEKFLDVAFALAKSGTIVHIYLFTVSQEEAVRVVQNYAKKMKKKIDILFSRITRSYSPKIVEVVVDFKIC